VTERRPSLRKQFPNSHLISATLWSPSGSRLKVEGPFPQPIVALVTRLLATSKLTENEYTLVERLTQALTPSPKRSGKGK
jgi:hypothetical protein